MYARLGRVPSHRRPYYRPRFVRYIVGQLKLFFPMMGFERIARILARAGLHLGATTVRRMSKSDEPPADVKEQVEERITRRVVTAKYPDHVYPVDPTVVPTRAGFRVPWLPMSLHQGWPFCWWMAVIHKVGRGPKYTITDQDSVFVGSVFTEWCDKRNIKPRYGAVGRHGSIAVIERCIRSMKDECTRRVLVPVRQSAMRKELSLYAAWYNKHRPHEWLEGQTPREAYEGRWPRNKNPRFEPRPNRPLARCCAAPQTMIRGKRGVRLNLVIGYLEGRKHLSVIELRKAA
jgi:transposase InsO family protein